MENKTQKERTLNLQYEPKDAKILRMVAALLDTTAKDMMLHATMSYLTNLATTTDDALLKSILKGEVEIAKHKCTCDGCQPESKDAYSECDKCGGRF